MTKPLVTVSRDWGSNKSLDLAQTPEVYLAWRDRELGHLTKDRSDIHQLLQWVVRQATPIVQGQLVEQAQTLEILDIDHVSYVLFEAIKHIIADSLLGRARLCDQQGFELWRRLRAEWEEASDLVLGAKAKRYQDPLRCASLLQLWDAVPNWEQLGNELELGKLVLPENVKSSCWRSSFRQICRRL